MTENRKNYLFGVAPGEWLIIATLMVGGVSSYTLLVSEVSANGNRSEENEEAIAEVQKQMVHEIQKSEDRTKKEIQEAEGRTREDIRELREIILRTDR